MKPKPQPQQPQQKQSQKKNSSNRIHCHCYCCVHHYFHFDGCLRSEAYASTHADLDAAPILVDALEEQARLSIKTPILPKCLRFDVQTADAANAASKPETH
jgi:hypothetical protein